MELSHAPATGGSHRSQALWLVARSHGAPCLEGWVEAMTPGSYPCILLTELQLLSLFKQ